MESILYVADLARAVAFYRDELGLEPTDFDLIFAYPWPGEEQVIYDLFDRFAAAGAVLITYHGVQGMRVQRKTSKRRKR